MGDNKKWSAADFAALLWIILHFYASVHAFMYGLYQNYTGWTWTLLSVWIVGLLALDAWLYVSGREELLRSLKWFWGFSAGLYGVMVLSNLLDWTMPDTVAVVFVICALVTPFFQMTAISWLLKKLAGLDTGNLMGFLFCLIHFIYIVRLHRRAVKKGAPPDGPVDPGAGTVE